MSGIDKLKQAAVQEIQKLEKKIGSLNKDIDKLKREKENALLDINETNIRKASAVLESDVAVNKSTELKQAAKKLGHNNVTISKQIDKLTEDAEKREIKLTADQDEVAKIKAETLAVNQETKIKAQGVQALRVQLENQIKSVKQMQDKKVAQAKRTDELNAELEDLKSEVLDNLKDAKDSKTNAAEEKVDAQIVLKECEAEKDKYLSLKKGLERKNLEKIALIKKSQDIIKNLQERELKVKNNESFNVSEAKSLKADRDRVALKEAKVTKILDSLLQDKSIEDKLKELGLSK